MKQFKNPKGRIDVLLSQFSANRLANEDTSNIQKELDQIEGLDVGQKRLVARGLKINVEEVVAKNLHNRDLNKLRWKK